VPRDFTLVSTRLRSPTLLRQRLHLAQALVHLLQPVGHLLEAFAQALLQRGVQLLVDRAAHFFQLGRVAWHQRSELLRIWLPLPSSWSRSAPDIVPSVPVSSVRKLLSARLWAASSAASRCASCASNAAKAASSSVRPVRDSATACASFSSTA
jgi:hypothetical protein